MPFGDGSLLPSFSWYVGVTYPHFHACLSALPPGPNVSLPPPVPIYSDHLIKTPRLFMFCIDILPKKKIVFVNLLAIIVKSTTRTD